MRHASLFHKPGSSCEILCHNTKTTCNVNPYVVTMVAKALAVPFITYIIIISFTAFCDDLLPRYPPQGESETRISRQASEPIALGLAYQKKHVDRRRTRHPLYGKRCQGAQDPSRRACIWIHYIVDNRAIRSCHADISRLSVWTHRVWNF